MLRSVHGTLLNAATVLVGTVAGTLLGERLPARIRETMLDGLGIVTVVVGVGYGLGSKNILIPLGCLLVGSLVGEAARIEDRLDGAAQALRRRLGVRDPVPHAGLDADAGPDPDDPDHPRDDGSERRFAEGFVVASLVFCIGPLTILGSLQNGLTGRIDQLALKAALDGFAALAFASALGWGVGASVVTILIYQGGLSLGAHALTGLLSERMILELNALGGLLIIGIGLRLLDVRRVRVANMLPGLLLVPVVVAVFVR